MPTSVSGSSGSSENAETAEVVPVEATSFSSPPSPARARLSSSTGEALWLLLLVGLAWSARMIDSPVRTQWRICCLHKSGCIMVAARPAVAFEMKPDT